MEKLKLAQAVIVEGRYDKIRLEAVADALILTTDGFGVFRDRELRGLIRRLARTCGIVILTDSDAAGFKIRAYLSDIARGGQVYQAYIPDVTGKERRKARPGREGKLGVEGFGPAALREALERAGLAPGDVPRTGLSRLDLYEAGLTGAPGSSELRRRLARRLGLPQRLSASALLAVLDRMLTPAQLAVLAQELRDGEEQA